MRKNFITTILLSFLIVTFNSFVFSQTSQNKFISEGIAMDKPRLESRPCPGYPQESIKQDIPVVAIEIKTLRGKDLKYDYSVSEGVIIGKGKKVKWDLSKVRPGIHTIAVVVKGKNNFQKMFTAKLDVPGCYLID